MSTSDIRFEEIIPTVHDFQTLRNSTGWGKLADDLVVGGLKNSLFCICAFSGKEIIGMGRVVGDGHIYFYVQDVIVLPKYQNRGVGKQLMNRIIDYLDMSAKKNAFIGLMAAAGSSAFYRKFGFKERSAESPGMYKMI